MAASPLPLGADAASALRMKKDEAIRSFSKYESSHAYTTPLFLRRFLEGKLSELPYATDIKCTSHAMLLLPNQTYEAEGKSILSMLCADCRHHFHVETHKGNSTALDDLEHPNHMLLCVPGDFRKGECATGGAEFICAKEHCFYTVRILVMPPALDAKSLDMLQDEGRVFTNIQSALADDPQRFSDAPHQWITATIPTLAKYIEDRLAKPSHEVLRIKKRNKRFLVTFGKDFDDLLPSLGFAEGTDEEGEECWYITPPEPPSTQAPFTAAGSRRAHLENVLEELRTFIPSAPTMPAWDKLMDALLGYLPRGTTASLEGVVEDCAELLGCLKESPAHWFSWAALLLSRVCPSRRNMFLDAGLRCIQQRDEDASLQIIMYRSQFDPVPAVDPRVKSAYEFLGASLTEDDASSIINKYIALTETNASASFKRDAFQHLEIISTYLGADLLGDVARENSLRADPHRTDSKRRMSIGSATRLLKVEANFNAELIRDFTALLDERISRPDVIEALLVLRDLKADQGQHAEAQSLKETADFLRQTESTIQPSRPEASTTTSPEGPYTTPPGLKNIGNTCYLNSLLQYFYNVKPVREMALSYDHFQLGLDDASVNDRRTGGNATRVTLEEAIVARQFVEELRRLFLELQSTTSVAASPSQKLANTALSSAKEILTAQSQTQPPPLPARPSPTPPSCPPKELITEIVTVNPISEEHRLARSDSSQTLVNDTDDAEMDVYTKERLNSSTSSPTGYARESFTEDQVSSIEVKHVEDITMEDITMEEVPSPPTLEQKISQISQQLERSDRSGTSQQDVEEIIGNILEHLMRAIRPDGPMRDKPDLQSDMITQLFFTTIVNSTIKTKTGNPPPTSSSVDENILNEEVVPERWITAFPHPNKEGRNIDHLYEALDRYFSYELLSDGNLARYTTIRALPPIVHICIQRSDASGVKNKNPVIIPEELYLDRYMEAAAGSELWNARRRVWAIKERIKALETGGWETVFKKPDPPTWDSPKTDPDQRHENQDVIDLDNDLWLDVLPRNKRSLERARLGDPSGFKPAKKRSVSSNTEVGISIPSILGNAGRRMDESNASELSALQMEETQAFDSMKQHKYCLHAIICHGGGMNAGHYWVWVRDFKNPAWYKYNDSHVTKDSRDSQQVIDELNNSGDPYYVAYVRDELKDALIEVPQRARLAQGVENDISIANSSEELEVIDSIAVETLAQPANSPVGAPVPEAEMEDAPAIELQA
ncbi:hypothetical protein F4802DRAFT_568969 [Xylaria palmicola]|nr:hypothetical protein F4802DRAFT_568969 [Xylaria palmicola]